MSQPLIAFYSPHRFTNRCSRIRFGDGIKVAVDIGGGAHIAISEPFPEPLHRHALCKKYRGAEEAKIMEADTLQIILFRNYFQIRDYFQIYEKENVFYLYVY